MFFLAARFFWPPIPQLVPPVCSSWFPRICGEGGCRLAHNLIPNKEKTKQNNPTNSKRKWQLLLLPRTKENEATLALTLHQKTLTLLHQTMTPTLALCAASSE